MTDHQVTLLAASIGAGAPILAVMLGILLNQMQVRGVENRMSSIQEDIREVRRDLKEIVSKLGSMDLEIAKLMDKR